MYAITTKREQTYSSSSTVLSMKIVLVLKCLGTDDLKSICTHSICREYPLSGESGEKTAKQKRNVDWDGGLRY